MDDQSLHEENAVTKQDQEEKSDKGNVDSLENVDLNSSSIQTKIEMDVDNKSDHKTDSDSEHVLSKKQLDDDMEKLDDDKEKLDDDKEKLDEEKVQLRNQWTTGSTGVPPPPNYTSTVAASPDPVGDAGSGYSSDIGEEDPIEPATDGDDDVVAPNKTGFNHFDFGLCIFSTIFYLIDWALNIVMFRKYFLLHKVHTDFVAYFWLTFVFIITTSLVTIVFEVVWYIDEKSKFGKGLSWWEWIVRIIFLVTLLGPAFRYFEVLHYARKNLKKKQSADEKDKVVQKSMEMKADADFFYMLEKFTESGLHLVLQMYIVKREFMKEEEELIGAVEGLKIVIAIILMPYTVTVYCRSQRQSKPHANDMTVPATFVQFLSRMFIIVSQAAALSFFLAEYPLVFVVIVVIHYFFMVVCVFVEDTKFCKWLWLEVVYRLFTAFIYMFNYFNVTEGRESYYKALLFYCYTFLERGLMMCFWCQKDVEMANVYRWPVLLSYFVLFTLGISIKLYYYTYHHPTRKPPTDLHRKILALPNRAPKNGGKAEATEELMNKGTGVVRDTAV